MPIINCPECNKELSDAAQSCPHCGFPLTSKNSTSGFIDGSTRPSKVRNVGLLLGVGILLFPYLFSWFTLRKGYATVTKLIAFAWLGCVVLLVNMSTSAETARADNAEISSISTSNKFWEKGEYIDGFGKKTGNNFVSNNKKIIGNFSNTATENSALGVDFYINKSSIDIKLYEYNRDVPIKSSRGRDFYLTFMYNDKQYPKQDSFYEGNLLGDRINFTGKEFEALKMALESNAEIKFNLFDSVTTTSSYLFEIPANTNPAAFYGDLK